MAIVGVTHEKDGSPRISRSVTVKLAIGLPPAPGSNHPQRLDHFTFLRKKVDGKEIKWVADQSLIEHYTPTCREVWIVLLDDEVETAFRTEYAAYIQRGVWCHGNGVNAMRRDLGRDGKQWSELKVFQGPCAEDGCPEIDKGTCQPSGDLYFMLRDFPTLGTICRLHTSSYQSIRQIYSALEDMRRVTGGRLMGVQAKLFMYPDRSRYENKQGETVRGTKWVIGLELAAEDLRMLQGRMLEAANTFASIRKQVGGATLQIDEDDAERGSELSEEFYKGAAPVVGEIVETDEQKLGRECDEVMKAIGLNQAQREQKLAQYAGRWKELLEKAKAEQQRRQPAAATPSPENPTQAAPATETPFEAPATTVSSDDSIAERANPFGPEHKEADPAEIGDKEEQLLLGAPQSQGDLTEGER